MTNDFIPRKRIPEQERFEKYVKKTAQCWNWTGGINTYGYGCFRGGDQKNHRAHRAAYRLYVGEIPKGKIIMHICDNRKCVNPKHLKVGTHRQNTIDMHQKGRWPDRKGVKHPLAKLKESDIPTIRAIANQKSHEEIAKLYGVTASTIGSVTRNETWIHV